MTPGHGDGRLVFGSTIGDLWSSGRVSVSDELRAIPGGDDFLKGWKEIAAYLRASERSVQRWERSNKLPILRVGVGANAIVFAHRRELETWLCAMRGSSAISARDSSGLGGGEPGVADDVPVHTVAVSSDGGLDEPAADVHLFAGDIPGEPIHLAKARSRRWATMGSRAAAVVLGSFLALATAGDVGGVPRGSALSLVESASSLVRWTARRQIVLVRLTMADGSRWKLGVPIGDIATCSIARVATYALSADRLPDAAFRVRVSRFDGRDARGAPQLVELVSVALRPGESTPVSAVPGLVKMEYVADPPTGRSVGAVAQSSTR